MLATSASLTRHLKAAMALLLAVWTTSMSAQLVISKTGNGKVWVDDEEPSYVYAIPDAGWYVRSVTWTATDPASPEPGAISFFPCEWSNSDYYLAPSSSGYVQVYFIEKTDNVKVFFNRNGHGTEISDQTLNLGETVTRPTPDPTEERYRFVGWYKNSKFTQPYDFGTVLDKQDLTFSYDNGYYLLRLYAKWVDDGDVHVTFDLNGHGSSAPAAQELRIGDKVTMPVPPTADGFRFVYWYKDSGCTHPYDFDGELNKTLTWSDDEHRYNLTLYARWASVSTGISGSCGKVDASANLDGTQVQWALSKQSADDTFYDLTLSGSGPMADFTPAGSPWYFFRHAIRNIFIDPGVTYIGDYAFEGITTLTELQFPTAATYSRIASVDLTQLTTLTLCGGGDMNNSRLRDYPWYASMKTIEHLNLDNRMTSISASAFKGCSALTEVVIPDSVTSIGNYAFKSCDTLTTLTLPVTTSANANVFSNCKALKKLIISGKGAMRNLKAANYPWNNQRKIIETLVIGDSVTHIGDNAFSNFVALTADITLPASVESIGTAAFAGIASQKNNPGINFATAEQSTLASIKKTAFQKANAKVDLTHSTQLTQGEGKTFLNVKADVILPSSMIILAKACFSTNKKSTAKLYILVPVANKLSVNGTIVEDSLETTTRLVDLTGYNNNKNKLTLAMAEDLTSRTITIADGICEAYKYNLATDEEQQIEVITKARVGETVVLSWGGETVPEGKYVSGFTISDSTNSNFVAATAQKNLEDEDYYFIMPSTPVKVTTQLADQYEYELDLTAENAQLEVPQMLWALLTGLNGYYSYDDATGKMLLDLNLDGTPDLELTQPAPEEDLRPDTSIDPEEDEGEGTDEGNDTGEGEGSGEGEDPAEEDPFADKYTVKRLAGADNVKMNCQFKLYYPFPLPYNSVLVKLGNSFNNVPQELIEYLDDDSDNATIIVDWAGDGKTHNVMLSRRTLYRDGSWNTLCLPFDVTISGSPLDLDGVEARTLTNASITGSTLNLVFGEPVTTLNAGVPYIIKWTAAEQNIVEPIFRKVQVPSIGITDADRQNENFFQIMDTRIEEFLAAKGYDTHAAGNSVITDERVRFLGTFKSTRIYSEDQSILFLGAENTLYYPQPRLDDPTQPWSDTNPMIYPDMRAFRACFKLGDDASEVRQIRDFNLTFGSEQTLGIGLTEPSPLATDPVANAWYTLQGKKLGAQPMQKGIYIHNHRKVIVK